MKPGRGSASFCLLRRAFRETKVRLWSAWWINLHTQHLEWQAAKGLRGGILHTTCLLSSSLNYPSVFTEQLVPTSTYQSWIFCSCCSRNKMFNHLQIKTLLSPGRRARAACGPRRWSEGSRVSPDVFSAVFLNHCCSLMWIIATNHRRRWRRLQLQLQAGKIPMQQKLQHKRSIDGDTESNTGKQYSNCFVKFITF